MSAANSLATSTGCRSMSLPPRLATECGAGDRSRGRSSPAPRGRSATGDREIGRGPPVESGNPSFAADDPTALARISEEHNVTTTEQRAEPAAATPAPL